MNELNLNIKYNISTEMEESIKRIETKLNKLSVPTSVKKKNLLLKSKVRSVASSLAIENIDVSKTNIEEIDKGNKVIEDKNNVISVKNALYLYNHIEEFNYLKEEDLLKAHMILMKYFEDDNGSYRKHGEGVKKGNKLIYVAPDSIIVPSLMKDLFSFMNENKELNPIVLASIFHYYLVFIHPFTDGNGRLARFWTSLILKKYNSLFMYIPFEEELYEEQENYFNAISESHNNTNCNKFIEFMIHIIETTIDDIITTQKTTQKLNKNELLILKYIREDKFITRSELADKLSITPDGVKYNLNKLKKLNIIKRNGSDRNGYYEIIDEKYKDNS